MTNLIEFSNLPNNFYVKLRSNFRKRIFRKFQSKFANIQSCINYLRCQVRSFYQYKNGNSYIPIKILRKILNFINVQDTEVNKNVLFLKKMNGNSIKISLPINSSPVLANLIGHTFGDCHISGGGRLCYNNKNKKLINEFKSNMKTIFNSYPLNFRQKGNDNKCIEIRYCSVIGDLLEICGAVKGNKTEKEFDVPKWIKNGTPEIKIKFIRALYDDEGTVGKRKNIRINLSKECTKTYSLITFFKSIKTMLLSFGIKTGKITNSKITINKDGKKKIKFSFFITGYKNLKLFYEIINFTHPLKSHKLENILDSYKMLVYQVNEANEIILKLLKNNGRMTTEEISYNLHRHKDTVLYHLKKLQQENKLRIFKNQNNTYWSLK